MCKIYFFNLEKFFKGSRYKKNMFVQSSQSHFHSPCIFISQAFYIHKIVLFIRALICHKIYTVVFNMNKFHNEFHWYPNSVQRFQRHSGSFRKIVDNNPNSFPQFVSRVPKVLTGFSSAPRPFRSFHIPLVFHVSSIDVPKSFLP